jgi:hypothetical protein
VVTAATGLTVSTVVPVYPAANATGVVTNSVVSVTFSAPVVILASSTFSLVPSVAGVATVGGTAVLGGFAINTSKTAVTFTPTAPLATSQQYLATLTTGVTSVAGGALASAYTWVFTTGAATDSVAPTIGSVLPLANASGVAIVPTISATFSKAIDPATLLAANFTLTGGAAVTITPTISGDVVTLTPSASLAYSTLYTATITTGVKDLEGNALASNYTWQFTTGAGAVAVNLNSAANYVIFSKTAIATTGTVAITGDVGTRGAASAITGSINPLNYVTALSGDYSTSGMVVGKLWAYDYLNGTPAVINTASNDMLAAYTSAANTVSPTPIVGSSSTMLATTYQPGVYKWSTAAVDTGSSLTLNGSSTDVYIFQISGNLTEPVSGSITLTGGLLASNIFWQVVGTVELGGSATFYGNILGATSITLDANATVHGRVLAQTNIALLSGATVEP